MGCGCGKKRNGPVDEDTPNPNSEQPVYDDNDAWWQAKPELPPTAAVPMPS